MRFLFAAFLLLFSAPGFAAEKTKLALNWKPEPQFGGFYAAQTSGAFSKNHLEVEILQGGAGTPVVQMIAAGQMEFGIASADEVVISRAHGSDVVALFAAYQTNPQGIMVHAERGFKSIADVYNSTGTLALQKGLPYALFLSAKYPKAKATLVPYLGGVQNFANDGNFSQQCFVTSEPLTAKKLKIANQAFLVADEGYNPYTTVLITRGDVIKKKPALVKSMVAAVRAGWRDYLDHPEITNTFMAGLNKSMDLATFKESADAQKFLIETKSPAIFGEMTETRWKQLADQLVTMKLINKAPDAKAMFQVF